MAITEEEEPLFSNSKNLFNVVVDDVNELQDKCNKIKTLGDVFLFWDKSKIDLFKISTELELLKLLLEKGK
jgi:hypothetical protein